MDVIDDDDDFEISVGRDAAELVAESIAVAGFIGRTSPPAAAAVLSGL